MGVSVLVVDDESDLRFIMRRFLEGAGYQVREAGDGEAALRLVREERPDLVVTDLMMPVMDGLQLIESLRTEPATQAIPVLVVSANWESAPEGADGLLSKPYDRKKLLALAQTLLEDGREMR